MTQFRHWNNIGPNDISTSVETFLEKFRGPSYFFLEGEDTSQTRAFVTLIHGNEPSGFYALHRWLQSGRKPAVNILCIIPSVYAAQKKPLFSHRCLPHARDLNRCFRIAMSGEFETRESVISGNTLVSQEAVDIDIAMAQEILALLTLYQCSAVVDMHNTSGSGPAFGVMNHVTAKHDALISLFTKQTLVVDLSLGALMELTSVDCPIITVECGGRCDVDAHEVAWKGLESYFSIPDLNLAPQKLQVQHLFHPVRLELTKRCTITYSNEPCDNYDVTLLPDVAKYNAHGIKQGAILGWARDALNFLMQAKNKHAENVLEHIVSIDISDGTLRAAQDLKVLMFTDNPRIAKTDCLFYAVKDDGAEITA